MTLKALNRQTGTPGKPVYLGWVSWGGGGGLIVMEDHHGEKPVATAQVPDDPVPRIITEDHR